MKKADNSIQFVQQVIKECYQKSSYFLNKSIEQLEVIEKEMKEIAKDEKHSKNKAVILKISQIASEQIDRRQKIISQQNQGTVYFGILKVVQKPEPQNNRSYSQSGYGNVTRESFGVSTENVKGLFKTSWLPQFSIVNPFQQYGQDQNKSKRE